MKLLKKLISKKSGCLTYIQNNNEPDLIGIPCMVCAEGIYFKEEDLNNAIHY